MSSDSATLSLTKQLISRQSVTPADDGCQALMIERLEKLGFEINRLRFG
ncbi:MAG: succinyl-diaminopimelate desuccinylase, partial [Porticoccaceae bacterium]|nr:succinyl-diaminopimelate desuccinylase [Porticoccaceae bacterium]